MEPCRREDGAALLCDWGEGRALTKANETQGFTITEGEEALSRYADTMTDSGEELTRAFCSHCGSNMFNFTALNDDIVSISAGAFDDFEDWRPTLEQYCIHRAEFLHEVKGVEKRFIESINGDRVKEIEPEGLS